QEWCRGWTAHSCSTSGTATLTIGSGITIHGQGTITTGNNCVLSNLGTILADSNGIVNVGPIDNQAALAVSGGTATLTDLDNSGTVTVTNAELDLVGNWTNAGTIT